MHEYAAMLYLLFDGQKFIRTCYSEKEAKELASKLELKDMYIKRVYDVDR